MSKILGLKQIATATALLCLMSGTAGKAQANLLTGGSFEKPVTTYYTIVNAGDTTLTGWMVTSGSVETDLTTATYGANAVVGLQNLDLDGNNPGAIAQTFSTIAGRSYALDFSYSNNIYGAGASAQVVVADGGTDLMSSTIVVHAGAGWSQLNWTSFSAVFVAQSASTTLSFTSLDRYSSVGILLDAVSVTPTPTPEPSTLAIAGLGAIAFLLHARRRFLSA